MRISGLDVSSEFPVLGGWDRLGLAVYVPSATLALPATVMQLLSPMAVLVIMPILPLPIANPSNAPTKASPMFSGRMMMFFLALFGSVPMLSSAQGESDKPRPEERPKPPFSSSGQRFGMSGGMKDTGWDQLSEDEKKKLRAAIEKVWEAPEVSAAREKIMKATEEMRTTLRSALEKSDPEAAKIMAKVKAPLPWQQHRGPPPVPRPEDPGFPRQAAMRLGFEMMALAKPEQREAFRHLHERVIELPMVKEAMGKLEAAPVGERLEAFKSLRDVYKKECEREIAEFRARHPKPEEKKP
jgi:hypothetical protein